MDKIEEALKLEKNRRIRIKEYKNKLKMYENSLLDNYNNSKLFEKKILILSLPVLLYYKSFIKYFSFTMFGNLLFLKYYN